MYSNDQIKEIFERGKKYNATHLITYIDCFEYSDFYTFVLKNETVDEVIDTIKKHGSAMQIDKILSYDKDIDKQLNTDKKKTYHL